MTLHKRLQALEARPPKVDPEHNRRFSAAIKAMLDTVNSKNEWARSTVAPFYQVEQPSDLEKLWKRIQSDTTTTADRALMDSWPTCHLTPAQLVQALLEVRDQY